MATTFQDAVNVNGLFTPSTIVYPAGSITNAALSSTLDLPRSKLVQETLEAHPVPLTDMRVWDAVGTVLPAAAANDDMGLITGTFGTDVPTLQSIDFKTTSPDEKCRFFFVLPVEYDDAQTITLRLAAGMITTVSDGTATVDAQCYKSDRAGAVGADICATAAQSINSLVKANVDFTITPTGLAPGDLLDIRLVFGGSDTATGAAVICEISQVEMLLDVRG